MFVYFYASFGVLGVVYLAFPMLAILGRRGAADGQAFVWAGLLIIAYGYGLSTNMIEQTFFAGVLGLLYGKAFAACQRQRARA